MNRRRHGISFQKKIKDYIVPIIWVILVFILIFSIFWWNDSEPDTNRENQTWLSIELEDESSEAIIEYSGWDRSTYEWDSDLYKWEKIIVREGRARILNPENWLDFNISRLGEILYVDDWVYTHSSWEVWVDTESPVDINMSFANLKIWEDSHLSISQNEVSSTIYMVSWFAEVNNLVWRNTVLTWWEKITVSRTDASDEEVDMSLLKDSLDQFFLRSDWYILNNWDSYLDSGEDWESWTWETSWSGEISWTWETSGTSQNSWNTSSWNRYLNFDNLIDESNVSSPNINIRWSYNEDIVTDFTVNWVSADLNPEEWTFELTWINTSNRVNDLVFKVYDDSNSIVSKFVYSVYYSDWQSSNNWGWWSGWGFDVQTFDADWEDFTFTSPTTTNTYNTTETFVTIRWQVFDERVDRVTVNDYELSSFDWSTWRYHADQDYNNLANWTNIYEINYFSWDNLVFTNYYTIIKREANDSTSWVISWESDI